MKYPIGCAVLLLALSGCGVPREAGVLAQRESQIVAVEDESAVRRELLRQAEMWERMDSLMKQRVLGGAAIDPRMEQLVARTAALARRQRTLMQAGTDDPRLNAAVLAELRGIWREAASYLQP